MQSASVREIREKNFYIRATTITGSISFAIAIIIVLAKCKPSLFKNPNKYIFIWLHSCLGTALGITILSACFLIQVVRGNTPAKIAKRTSDDVNKERKTFNEHFALVEESASQLHQELFQTIVEVNKKGKKKITVTTVPTPLGHHILKDITDICLKQYFPTPVGCIIADYFSAILHYNAIWCWDTSFLLDFCPWKSSLSLNYSLDFGDFRRRDIDKLNNHFSQIDLYVPHNTAVKTRDQVEILERFGYPFDKFYCFTTLNSLRLDAFDQVLPKDFLSIICKNNPQLTHLSFPQNSSLESFSEDNWIYLSRSSKLSSLTMPINCLLRLHQLVVSNIDFPLVTSLHLISACDQNNTDAETIPWVKWVDSGTGNSEILNLGNICVYFPNLQNLVFSLSDSTKSFLDYTRFLQELSPVLSQVQHLTFSLEFSTKITLFPLNRFSHRNWRNLETIKIERSKIPTKIFSKPFPRYLPDILNNRELSIT